MEGKDQSRLRASLPVPFLMLLPESSKVGELCAGFCLGAFSLKAVTASSHRASCFCLVACLACHAKQSVPPLAQEVDKYCLPISF
jgi:hypothetical protein